MLSAELRASLREIELDVGIEVPVGRCLALLGPSGAGKTSVLRALAGLLPVTGRIACGEDVWQEAGDHRSVPPERRGCGMVFQDYALFPHLTARQNVAYGVDGRRAARRERAGAELDRLGVGHLADEVPARMSGGERQRVAVARALARDPRVLLLDEPLAALDQRTAGDAVRRLAAVLRASSAPAIVVTHDFAEASVLADEIAVMESGSIVQLGTAADLAAAPASAFVAELTGASILRGTATRRTDGLSVVLLASGAEVLSVGGDDGPVAVVLRPWDVAVEPPGAAAAGSPRNHLPATIVALTPLGGRVRVGLALPEPLAAEITAEAAARLGLAVGGKVTVSWKATATRLVPQ